MWRLFATDLRLLLRNLRAMGIQYGWRGTFGNGEANQLHAEAFGTRVFSDEEWDWVRQTDRHSLGWVTARDSGILIGFVNVPWDGLVHAWIQDTMVAVSHRHRGVGRGVIAEAVAGSRAAGCEWLHVDYDDELKPFYEDACGFVPTAAGLIRLG